MFILQRFQGHFQFSLDEDINNIFFKASVLGCLRSFSITNGKGPKNERNVLKYFFRLESLDTPPVVAGLLLAIILLCLATVQSRGKQSCSLAVCWYICLEVWWVSNTLQLVSLGSICLVCSQSCVHSQLAWKWLEKSVRSAADLRAWDSLQRPSIKER